jgi:hypothetical protein
MSNKIQKAINISKKTGDRIIVFDGSEDDNPYIIMSLEDYEKITIAESGVRDLTEDELLDKINRDIAIWKSENEELPLAKKLNRNINNNFKRYANNADDFDEDEYEEYAKEELDENDADDFDEDEDTYYYEEKENPFNSAARKSGNIWKIPKDVKRSAEEVM